MNLGELQAPVRTLVGVFGLRLRVPYVDIFHVPGLNLDMTR